MYTKTYITGKMINLNMFERWSSFIFTFSPDDSLELFASKVGVIDIRQETKKIKCKLL